MNSKHFLILPLLMIAVSMMAEPIVRVVSNSADKAFATDDVRKLVLTAENVDVVNDAGTVLMTVPVANSVRVELTEGTPTPTGMDGVQSTDRFTDRAQKILRDGQILILHNSHTYPLTGQEVR